MPRRGFLVTSAMALVLGPPSSASDIKSFDDATLRAVRFLDAHEGWAVGDQGTVWHTMDGGELWERQATGARATLTAIDMQDFRIGWIAGRESVPYNPGATGVMMWTRDGGGRWLLSSRQQLSGLAQLHFFDADRGWGVAQSTDQHPTGLFFTTDGGRVWKPFRGPRFAGWRAAWFADFEHVLIGGENAKLLLFSQGVTVPSKLDWIAGSSIRALTGSGQRVWAVGDQAQVAVSEDQGRTWKKLDTGVPLDAARVWNLHAAAAVGDSVWIAGRPGSVILHSPDGGKSWKRQRAPSPLPLEAIHFPDAKHGWAVGALGTIIATEDGGETWTIQRQGGDHAPLLWMTADAATTPLSVIARYGGENGHLAASWSLTRADADDAASAVDRPLRWSDGFRAAGGAAVDGSTRFPLAEAHGNDSIEDLMSRWNRLHEGRAAKEIERELVLAIRLWRPRTVVTDSPTPGPSNPTSRAVLALGVRRAFAKAADNDSFPELKTVFGIEPHQPGRLYARDDASKDAVVRHASADVGPRLGETFADTAEAAMAHWREEYARPEPTAAFVLLDAKDEKAETDKRLLVASPDPAGRRQVRPIDEEQSAMTREQVEKKRNFLAMTERGGEMVKPEQLLASIRETAASLDPPSAGRLIFQLARRYVESGQWELASDLFEHLVEAMPQHPLSIEAYCWLIAFQSSGEAYTRWKRPVAIEKKRTSFAPPDESGESKPVSTSSRVEVQGADMEENAARIALQLASKLRATSGHRWSDPRVQLLVASALRKTGDTESLQGCYSMVAAANPSGAWATAAALENHFFKPSGAPPRPVIMSVPSDKKPYLDGRLDDACWKEAAKQPLLADNERLRGGWTTSARICHDSGHLYIAAECKCPKGTTLAAPIPRAGRDANLAGFDRVDLLIDLDRDYNTFYRLSVDQRGLVADECWGDASWDPKWFVATDRSAEGWKLEVAIPFTELAKTPDLATATWGFNIVRVIPGQGVLSCSRPAGDKPRPEGMTHLRFGRHKTAKPPLAPVAN